MVNPNYIHAESFHRPEPIEKFVSTVYIRKDISREERVIDDKTVTVYTYLEAAMSPADFKEYSDFIKTKKVLSGEADENQLIIMEAIADLYAIIENMQQGGVK